MKFVATVMPKSVEEAESLDVSRYMGADIIEWRADVLPVDKVLTVAPIIFETFAGYEIIFGLRTPVQGGQWSGTIAEYVHLIKEVQTLYQPDYVDFDYYSFQEELAGLQDFSNLILSYYNFDKVPENLMEIFSQLTGLSPRVIRICVNPKNQQEVLDVMNFTRGFKTLNPEQTYAVAAMGEHGQVTRVFGDLFGSSWTFVKTDQESSPAQLTLADTKTILDILENHR